MSVGKRVHEQILRPHPPTPTPSRIFEVVPADERGILGWLLCGQVRDEPSIAERRGITIEHEDTAAVAGQRQQLTATARLIDVYGDGTTGAHMLAATRGLPAGRSAQTSSGS